MFGVCRLSLWVVCGVLFVDWCLVFGVWYLAFGVLVFWCSVFGI